MKQSFFAANKVFLLGLAASILVVVQQFALQPTVDWIAFGYAALMALLSFIANEWRGQGVTITGIIGTLASVFVTNFNGGHVNWQQFMLLSIAAILAAVAPPPKNQSYETGSSAKMILLLIVSGVLLSSCTLFKNAQAPKYDDSAVAQVTSIKQRTDSLYQVIQFSSDKSFGTYRIGYESILGDITVLQSYDSTRKHSSAILVIVNDTRLRLAKYSQEHSAYVSINNAQANAYKQGMDALLNILIRTETNYKK